MRPNISGLLIAVALGILIAVGLYQAQIRGLIPILNLSSSKVPKLETRTIISEENAVVSAVDKTSPSVVAIGISQKIINPFDPFAQPTKQDSTIGTGFVVSDKGLIVTNKHVVSENGIYTVVTRDGQKYEVRKIYRDPNFDLAIVQIDSNDLQPLELGDSSKLKVGQTMIAIGNALGKFTNTVTVGVVSGLGRKVVAGDIFNGSSENLDDLIQTDAAINPGNSGGPLLSSSGQVIGVSVAVTAGAQNIGFAIPINSVKKIVDEFATKGFISRPYLGIQYKFIPLDLANLNGVPPGAYIQTVLDQSPAEKSGLRKGDIITQINGTTVDVENTVSDIISKSKIGQELELTIYRNGKQFLLKVTLIESPNL